MLEVKRLWSPDLPDGKSLPDDPENCSVLIQADIGPHEAKGGDTFDFEVWTPTALMARVENDPRAFWARAVLIMPRFSWGEVERALNQMVRSSGAPTWEENAQKLNRFARWEFEDYSP